MNKLKQNKKIYIVSLIIVLVALAIVITVTKNRTPQKKPQDKIHKQETNKKFWVHLGTVPRCNMK